MAEISDVVLTGHLTASILKSSLAAVEPAFGKGMRPALLVDATAMTGYDHDARSEFVTWNAEHRGRVVGVAIVTTNKLWEMIIAAMSLASKQKMKAFATRAGAAAWCSTL